MKLKLKISIIIVLVTSTLSSQSILKKDSLVEFILDTKIYKVYNPPVIVANLDSLFLEYHLSDFRLHKSTSEFTNRYNGITLTLTNNEKTHILKSFESQLKAKWDNSQFPENELILYQNLKEHLSEDPNNTLVIISEPIYIRNKTLAVVFFSNLCGGSRLGGFVELSIFRRDKNQWEKYIQISGADF